jgi:hypothetical protein
MLHQSSTDDLLQWWHGLQLQLLILFCCNSIRSSMFQCVFHWSYVFKLVSILINTVATNPSAWNWNCLGQHFMTWLESFISYYSLKTKILSCIRVLTFLFILSITHWTRHCASTKLIIIKTQCCTDKLHEDQAVLLRYGNLRTLLY